MALPKVDDDTQMLWDAVAEKNVEILRLRAALREVQDWFNVVGVGPVPTALRMKVLDALTPLNHPV